MQDSPDAYERELAQFKAKEWSLSDLLLELKKRRREKERILDSKDLDFMVLVTKTRMKPSEHAEYLQQSIDLLKVLLRQAKEKSVPAPKESTLLESIEQEIESFMGNADGLVAFKERLRTKYPNFFKALSPEKKLDRQILEHIDKLFEAARVRITRRQ